MRPRSGVTLATSAAAIEHLGDRARQVVPDLAFVPVGRDALDPTRAAGVEIAFFDDELWSVDLDESALGWLVELPSLRWLHTFMGGTDHPLYRRLLDRGVTLTCSAGARTTPMAEYVLAMMLLVVRRMDLWWDAQRERAWRPHRGEELAGKTVGIVGVGRVGGEVARLSEAFGMKVLGCRRSGKGARHVDRMFPLAALDELLASSDFVVLTVPLTKQTEGLLDEARLRAMRPSAWLINPARGRLVDEPALVRALVERRIGGACLDVFSREPLPAESELWTLPNVIVTPHNSPGQTDRTQARIAEMFLDNLGRWASGRPLSKRVRPVRLEGR